jgi:hypothetical protein
MKSLHSLEHRKVWPILMTLAGLALAPRLAAQPSEGASAYQRGHDALVAKNWDEAYRLLRPLWPQQQTYEVALSLGQTELYLGKYRDAAEHLAAGLRIIPLNVQQRNEIATRAHEGLGQAKQHVATLALSVDKPGAEVRIDGHPVGRTPLESELYADPGMHTIVVSLAAHQDSRQVVSLPAGEERKILMQLGEAEPPKASTPENPTRASEPSERQDHDGGADAKTVAVISGAALSLIGLTTTIVFAVKRSNAESDIKDLQNRIDQSGPGTCEGPNPASECHELKQRLDDRDRASVGFNISWPITAAAAAGTAIMFFAWPASEHRTAPAAILTPLVGRDAGGLMLSGKF